MTDLENVVEPPANPLKLGVPEAAPPVGGPVLDSLPLAPPEEQEFIGKSPRFAFECYVTTRGHRYGPVVVNAVDEAEAKQLIFDANQQLKRDAIHAKWQIRRKSGEPVNKDELSGKKLDWLNEQREREGKKPLKPAGSAK